MKGGSVIGRSKVSKKINVTVSSGNVFEDLGLPGAEERLLKAQLASQIQRFVEQKGMTQSEIAPLLGLDQPKVSNLMCGRLGSFSVERLFGILNRLGHNIEVRISKKEYRPEEAQTIVVA
jgi:predicted XRE-type DNA-binding protein